MPSVCAQGSLTIREGTDSSGKLVKRLCGEVNPPVVFSAGQHFWVQFKADPGNKLYYSGFNATYETVQACKYCSVELCSLMLCIEINVVNFISPTCGISYPT